MNDFWAAAALVLVLEGILPFLAPAQWREAVQSLAGLRDGQLRTVGLGSMLIGLLLLAWVRG
ncbi:MAG: DUF2065 domain-containing protein [Lysobacterales bacterium]